MLCVFMIVLYHFKSFLFKASAYMLCRKQFLYRYTLFSISIFGTLLYLAVGRLQE